MRKVEAVARQVVYARSGGVCEKCGQCRGAEWQHRKNRSQGGLWQPSNGLHLCSPCHRWVTGNPTNSRDNGWSVSRELDPAAAKVRLSGDRWVLLDDEGGVIPCA